MQQRQSNAKRTFCYRLGERILTHIGEPRRPPAIAPARGPAAWDATPVEVDPADALLAQPESDMEFDHRIHSTSLLAPLSEASLRWYLHSYAACGAVESPILNLASVMSKSHPKISVMLIGCLIVLNLTQSIAAQRPDSQGLERQIALADSIQENLLIPERNPYQASGVIERKGDNIKDLAQFVRHEIALEPYLGAVRGVEGTLAAKAGSDWDRALLLQALLDEVGIESKLRVIPRTKDEIIQLLRLTLDAHPTSIPTTEPESRAMPDYLQRFAVDPASLKAVREKPILSGSR